MTDTTDKMIRSDEGDTAIDVEDHSAPFEPDQVEKLPHLQVPALAPDATGLSAEALSQVPTLTESVAVDVVADALAVQAQDADVHTQPSSQAQASAVHAESWMKACEARINDLMNDIHQLHERLDQLESKAKV